MSTFENHELAPDMEFEAIRYELRPVQLADGSSDSVLQNAWIWLNNPKQFNCYSTRALAELILAIRRASADPRVQVLVVTGEGDKAFCTGGDIAEYSEHYAGRPDEYRRYMRVFNDAISALMHCDKPVVNRANGMRIGGGQEIGLACDFSIAADTARFGQAGPKHGSSPVGGSTDMLPVYVGMGRAMESCVLCENWSAHRALQLGIINDLVPVLKVDGAFLVNPLVHTEFVTDACGRSLYGMPLEGEPLREAKAILKKAEVDFELLDAAVENLCTRLALTFPDCLTYTLENLRKHKLQHWDRNRETSRAWLSLNMMTEGRMGFRTFHRAPKEQRQVDFLELRRGLAKGMRYGPELDGVAAPFAREDPKE
ncbi:MAG: enoyl-CoA hydratase-related protein [Planctomycetota bacterium]